MAGPFNQGRFACQAASTTLTSLDLPAQEEARYTLLEQQSKKRFSELDVLQGFGFVVAWDPALHAPPSALQPLRSVGDPKGDAAAEEIKNCVLRSGVGKPIRQGVSILRQLQDSSAPARDFLAAASVVPAWVDWHRVHRGQRFFLRNIGPIGLALLNLSLIGGFGAPKINAVLEETGYLTRGNGTARRLSETLQMVLDCCVDAGDPGADNAMRPGGKGWESVLNVRLLHAGVRTWLLSAHSHHSANSQDSNPSADGSAAGTRPLFDVSRYGVPINQEDLLVTMAAFSSVVCIGLERCRLLDNERDVDIEDYFHLWKLIGHYIGIDFQPQGLGPSSGPLKTLLQSCDTLKGGQALLESIAAHLVIPDPSSRRIALHVIESCSYRPPVPRTPYLHVLLTRMLAGEDYATAIGIPQLEDDDLFDMDTRAKAKAEREERQKQEKEKAAQEQERAAKGWLGRIASALSIFLPQSASKHPLYLPVEEGDDGNVIPLRSSSGPSIGEYCKSVLKGAAWVTVVLPIMLSARVLAAAYRAHASLHRAIVKRTTTGERDDKKAREEEKAERIANARKTADLVLGRYRFISRLTHLPVVGDAVARLLVSGVVSMIEAQLGGRTEFPIRRRYL